jgi:hypothetical protein
VTNCVCTFHTQNAGTAHLGTFNLCSSLNITKVSKMKVDEMGDLCSVHGEQEEYICNLI